jgi:hypothetical protein
VSFPIIARTGSNFNLAGGGTAILIMALLDCHTCPGGRCQEIQQERLGFGNPSQQKRDFYFKRSCEKGYNLRENVPLA